MSNLVVQTNVLALNSHRNLKVVGQKQFTASARLSSGYRINSAADDAAGLAISEKMRAQIRGLDMATKNAQDAISLVQTAEGGMQEIDNMLQRIRELTVQASNDTNEHNRQGTGDRQKIQDEVNQLVREIDSMATRVEFNGKKLIDGTYSGGTSSSSTIARLQDALKDATIAANNAKATRDASGNAYVQYTGSTAGNFANALKAFYGNADVLNGLGTYASGTGVLGEAQYALLTVKATDTASAIGQLADLYKTLANVSKSVNTYSGSAITDVTAATATGADADFGAFLKKLAINVIGDFTGLVDDVTSDNAFKGSGTAGATIAEVLAVDLENYTSGVFGASTSIDTLRKIAEYQTSGGDIETSNIQNVKKLAADIVNAYDSIQAFTAPGGALETSKKALDAAVQAEKDIKADFRTKADAYKVAKAEQDIAQAKLDAAQAIGGGTQTGNGLFFQVGANAGQGWIMNIGSVKSDTLGIGDGKGATDIDVLKASGVNITNILNTLDVSLSYVTTQRSLLGAAQNRLEFTMRSLEISSENLSAAESRIRDADMAKEMMKLTAANVLQQAGVSMLAQANQSPQSVLQLLR